MSGIDRDLVLQRIDVRRFYESFGRTLRNVSGGSGVVTNCPFHEDTSASLSISLEKNGVYQCHAGSCGEKGSPFDFFMKMEKVTFPVALKELAKMAGIEAGPPSARKKTAAPKKTPAPVVEETPPPIPEDVVLKDHARLLGAAECMKFLLEKRGLTEESIQQYQLGWDGDRYCIPIRDSQGVLVNIRKYKPGAKENKMISYTVRGMKALHGKARLYPLPLSEGETLILCEGELDAIVARIHGFPAHTVTSGSGVWNSGWNGFFSSRNVILCYDNDVAGRVGADKVAKQLQTSAASVRLIQWPREFPDKYDITDYFVLWGGTTEGFQELLNEAKPYEEAPVVPEMDAIAVELSAASNSSLVGKRISMKVMVAGKITRPYQVPKTIKAYCDQNAKSMCNGCGMHEIHHGTAKIQFSDRDRMTLGMIHVSDTQQKGAIADKLGLGGRPCRRWGYTVEKEMNVERLTVIPEVSGKLASSAAGEYVTRTVFAIGEDLNIRTNATYEASGYVYPQPNDQLATCLIGKMEPVEASIDNFQVDAKMIESLKVFQRGEQSVSGKMYDIAAEMTKVHGIWGRPELQITLDLSWHSVLAFHLFGRYQHKGYVEVFIAGDSGQGKTTAALALADYYRCGTRIQAEQSSAAGLIGGITKNADRYEVSWGAIVLADRSLLIIDEFSGIKDEDAERLTDVRSMGYAEIVKIERQKAPARTRLVFLTNPKDGRTLASYEHGVEAIYPGLFKKAEDVRRIDIALAVASNEIPLEKLNENRPVEECVYTTEQCSALVMWAWSRKPDQIKFAAGVEDEIKKWAIRLSNKYSSRIPLIEPADVRWKLARLAAAAAARQFSTKDGITLDVEPEHVTFVAEFIDTLYSSRVLAYDRFSLRHNRSERYVQENKDMIIRELKAMDGVPAAELVELLMTERYLTLANMAAQLDLERKAVQKVIRFLTKHRCLEQTQNGFRKKPAFVEILRGIEDRGWDDSKPSTNGHHPTHDEEIVGALELDSGDENFY